MKKQQIKNYLKLGIFLFGISFLFVNCDKDDSQHEVDTKQKVQSIIQRVSFEEMQQNRVLSEKLNLIKNKKKTSVDGKLVYSNAFHFYIETDEAIYIESEDGLTHSYTFAIMRAESTTELENLVLYLQEDGTYAMKIVTYQYTEQDRLDQANGLHVDLTNKVSYQSINDDGVITSIFSLEVACLTIVFEYCGNDIAEHNDDLIGSQCSAVETDSFDIGSGCGGGGGSSGGGFDSGSDSSTSDSSGTTNTTSGNNYGGGGTSTSPIEPPDPPTDAEVIENCIGIIAEATDTTNPSFTPEMIVWLNASTTHPSVIAAMKDYLATHGGCNTDNQQLIIDAIQAIIDGLVDTLEEYIEKRPCIKINEQVNDVLFQDKVDDIRSNLNLPHEVGYGQKTDGSFYSLPQNGSSTSVSIPISNYTKGFIHIHQNAFEVPDKNGDGIPETVIPHKILSDTDVLTYIDILLNAHNNNIPLADVFGSNYSSGNNNFTLRFTGNIANVQNNYTTTADKETLRKKYKEYFDQFKSNKIKAFLLFLKNEINIPGIRLFKMKNNGDIQEKKLDDNNHVDTIDCD